MKANVNCTGFQASGKGLGNCRCIAEKL